MEHALSTATVCEVGFLHAGGEYRVGRTQQPHNLFINAVDLSKTSCNQTPVNGFVRWWQLDKRWLGVSRPARMKNVDIVELGLDLTEIIIVLNSQKRLLYFGLVDRMEIERYPHTAV